MNYIYLESNWHIVQGDKTACGMDILDDAETAAPALAPQCPMCWVKREAQEVTWTGADLGRTVTSEEIIREIYSGRAGYVIGDTLTNDPNTWGEAVTVRTYDADGTAALLRIDYNEPPISS